ncbi:TAXI family TRAP transporter solute-binding subunit, partial [Arthrospira platensis SPKY1]|nr:TAXI family TRAP transporter solute-binding subunit [Arthrospira platensis SPKY1]
MLDFPHEREIVMKKLAIATLTVALLLGAGGANAAEEKFITIGTGGQTGVYYVVGQSICRLVNRGEKEHGIKCTAPSTGGSVANLNAIRVGEQDLGIVQSDQQYKAMKGLESFE